MQRDDLIPIIEKAVLYTDPPIKGRVQIFYEKGCSGVISSYYSDMMWYNKVLSSEPLDTDKAEVINHFIDKFSGPFQWFVLENSRSRLHEELTRQNFFQRYFLKVLNMSIVGIEPAMYENSHPTFVIEPVVSIEQQFDLLVSVYDLEVIEEKKEDFMFRKANSEKVKSHMYGVWKQNEPVGCGYWLEVPESKVAYLYRAFIKEAHRGQGAYSALLNRRIYDIMDKFEMILTIANKETSYPILHKKGFTELFDMGLYSLQNHFHK